MGEIGDISKYSPKVPTFYMTNRNSRYSMNILTAADIWSEIILFNHKNVIHQG